MGLLDKVKNLFTEEIEEEPVVRRETRHQEEVKPSIEKFERVERKEPIKPVEIDSKPVKEEILPKREDKFVYFTDDDFKDLEKPKKEVKEEVKQVTREKPVVKKEEPKQIYKGAVINPQPQIEKKKEFKPSPIISPVYGVLDKNYEKGDIKPRKSRPTIYSSSSITIDEVRNKAFGNLEDEIKPDVLGKAFIEQTAEEVVEPNINIFDELDNYEEPELISKRTSNVDEIFGRLNTKKDEILDELDDKKDEIFAEIDSKANSIDLLSREIELEPVKHESEILEEDSSSDIDLAKSLLDDEDALELAEELEEQKKKLKKINDMMNENEKVTKTKSKKKKVEPIEEDNLDESELFDLIDSTFEKKDDE